MGTTSVWNLNRSAAASSPAFVGAGGGGGDGCAHGNAEEAVSFYSGGFWYSLRRIYMCIENVNADGVLRRIDTSKR
jgi:hypothetical protein